MRTDLILAIGSLLPPRLTPESNSPLPLLPTPLVLLSFLLLLCLEWLDSLLRLRDDFALEILRDEAPLEMRPVEDSRFFCRCLLDEELSRD
jgi:hypothetical protein